MLLHSLRVQNFSSLVVAGSISSVGFSFHTAAAGHSEEVSAASGAASIFIVAWSGAEAGVTPALP